MKKMMLPSLCMLMASCGFFTDNHDFESVLRRAERGDAVAQYELARMYDLGEYGLEDNGESLNWYRMAADQGLLVAQHRVGLIYEIGIGTEKDEVEAAEWYFVAAEMGHPQSQYEMGRMLYLGLGGHYPDHSLAADYFHKSAEQGNAKAQHTLGEMYYAGMGVEQSYYHSYLWLSVSASKGGAGSAVRDSSAKALTPDDLKTAENHAMKLAREIETRKSAQGARLVKL